MSGKVSSAQWLAASGAGGTDVAKPCGSMLFCPVDGITCGNTTCLVLSCLVFSCLSCLVLPCLVLSCLVLSYLVLSCLVLSCLVWSSAISSNLILGSLLLTEFTSDKLRFFCRTCPYIRYVHQNFEVFFSGIWCKIVPPFGSWKPHRFKVVNRLEGKVKEEHIMGGAEDWKVPFHHTFLSA